MEQFVRTGRSTEHGLKTFIAKAAAGDVIVMVAMIDRIAGLLLLDSDPRPISLRRATAFGLLATRCAPSRCCRDTPPPPSPRRHPNHTTPDRPQDHPDGGDPASGDGVDGGSGGSITDSGDEADQNAGDGTDQPMDDSPGGAGGGGWVSEDPGVVGEGDLHPCQNDADDPHRPPPGVRCAAATAPRRTRSRAR